MTRPKITFATCVDYPDLTEDDRLTVAELARVGIDVVPWVWDRAAESETDLVIVRSCWDYHRKTAEFTAWLKAGHNLLNPASVALWNLNKRYLAELEAWGQPVPRTLWIDAGAKVDLAATLEQHAFQEVVVKPVVGMLGIDTFRVSRETAHERQGDVDRILAERGIMIQEFVSSVLTEGEVSLVFIDSDFSHALRKRPRHGEFRIHEEYGGTREVFRPAESMVRQGQELLSHLPALLYARVDGIPRDGQLVLMELELIDPHLFLAYDNNAPRRFAEAIAARV